MAARLLQLRRALSLLFINQQRTPYLFQDQFQRFPTSADSSFNRSYFRGTLFQRQICSTLQTNEGSESNEYAASDSAPQPANVPTPITTNEGFDVKHKVVSNLKVNPRHDFMMIFTCKVCETRSVKMASRESYEKGVVVARCAGCDNLHLIADRLGWFGEPGSIEDFLAARGEEVKRESCDSLNLTLQDLAGKKISND